MMRKLSKIFNSHIALCVPRMVSVDRALCEDILGSFWQWFPGNKKEDGASWGDPKFRHLVTIIAEQKFDIAF